MSELTPDIALLASGIKDGIRELLALVSTAHRGKALSEISV